MSDFSLTSIDIQGLRAFSNQRDVLRDLFTYLNYAAERSIKRMTRTNEIPRADQQKLARLMGGLSFEPGAGEIDASQWIDFIDYLAYSLHLVSFDIKGEYRGMSSSEPSFTDNYIIVNDAPLRKFLDLSPVKQEKRILEALKDPPSFRIYETNTPSEFFKPSVLGELDPFSNFGSATGVIPLINFPLVRQFLLDLLAKLAPGIWYSTDSLIQYLKSTSPYFLIPQKIPKDRWGNTVKRYENFHEGKDRWDYSSNTVPEDAPDAFERVEGRYVERFLENIPLLMRFVDVAYDPATYQGLLPSRGTLKAFRVNERLERVLSGIDVPVRVTIQPNFDVLVESYFYPEKILRQVAALSEPVSSPQASGAYVGMFLLTKTRVAAEQVRQPDLDVAALLKTLSGRDLPPNVQIELEEWSGHAEQFTLYEGFALLESVDQVPDADKDVVEHISEHVSLIRNAQSLFKNLEKAGRVPLLIPHPDLEFFPLSETVVSAFPKGLLEEEEEQETAIPIRVSCVVSVTARFPDEASFDAFRKMLAELRCPFQSDSKLYTITYEQKNQAKFEEAVQRLADVYQVEIV